MELASYIYAAWAHEQASQDFCDRNGDQVCATLPAPPVIGKWQACLLTAIAITNVGSCGWSGSAAASHILEPAVNTAPWCDHLYLCQTEYILEVQTLLAQRGFAVGEIDGVYGRNTKQAVIEFQNSQASLAVDGIPGAATLAALKNYPAQSKPRLQTKTQVRVTPTRNKTARTQITREITKETTREVTRTESYRQVVIVRSVNPHNLRNRDETDRDLQIPNSNQNSSKPDHNSS
ncbi:peptidoglycan-binding domain-containing protein [Pseudanabaena mucicola]|uniref:Peptidoglycan-binding protein n=1 Tax=Pseudanabaena mucicola FACHB-723 TaxID=2692860 RepID=A0ABR7ZS31_9CYAN|nr:peptidoglycan-binding domain-containing protein [Pseudanabaena mucicola]MBD2186580.1 peptidoglycan-binding protein [Pseudanabaena mucicola FACHB-723]